MQLSKMMIDAVTNGDPEIQVFKTADNKLVSVQGEDGAVTNASIPAGSTLLSLNEVIAHEALLEQQAMRLVYLQQQEIELGRIEQETAVAELLQFASDLPPNQLKHALGLLIVAMGL